MGISRKITEIFEKIGEKTLEICEKPIRRTPQGKSIRERLKLLKKMQEEIEREKEIEELIEWGEKELQKTFSERFAEAILKYFRDPVESLGKSISGLEYDLYRANIRMSKDKYVALMLGISIITGVFSFLIGLMLMFPIDLSLLLGLLGLVGGFLYMRNYPKIVWRKRVAEVERALPYVLRHLASLLSAGVGIAEAMLSVAKADYGVISEEFGLVVRDMRGGASFEEALTKFEERMTSENVSRVVEQILRAIKFGGNLSSILYKLAEDFSFEYRMRLMDYVQKVNGLTFVYMFISVIMPTMLVVAILAASIMTKTLVIPVQGLAAILLFGFPAMAFLMVVMIKRSEPR